MAVEKPRAVPLTLVLGGFALACRAEPHSTSQPASTAEHPPSTASFAAAAPTSGADHRCDGFGSLHVLFDFEDKLYPKSRHTPFERVRSYEFEFTVDGTRTLCHLALPEELEFPPERHLPPEVASCAFTLWGTGEPGGLVFGGRPKLVAVRIRSHGVPMYEGSVAPRYENPSDICIFTAEVRLTADRGGP